mmetsp:Transcript_139837/g.243535  ORF Transcript_139837/g.243535 Transcript_139837/m.243535 type:complete len:109 (-) Transcript_139837:869-1195(-)
MGPAPEPFTGIHDRAFEDQGKENEVTAISAPPSPSSLLTLGGNSSGAEDATFSLEEESSRDHPAGKEQACIYQVLFRASMDCFGNDLSATVDPADLLAPRLLSKFCRS